MPFPVGNRKIWRDKTPKKSNRPGHCLHISFISLSYLDLSAELILASFNKSVIFSPHHQGDLQVLRSSDHRICIAIYYSGRRACVQINCIYSSGKYGPFSIKPISKTISHPSSQNELLRLVGVKGHMIEIINAKFLYQRSSAIPYRRTSD